MTAVVVQLIASVGVLAAATVTGVLSVRTHRAVGKPNGHGNVSDSLSLLHDGQQHLTQRFDAHLEWHASRARD